MAPRSHSSVLAAAALFALAALVFAIASVTTSATPVEAQAQANTCTNWQGSRSVSGSPTTLDMSGYANCQTACTAYAGQIGNDVNCQLQTAYTPTYEYVCYPTPPGYEPACGWYDTGGAYSYTCSAGRGGIVSNASTYSAGTCTVPPPAPIVSVTASPSSVQNGGTTMISWESENAGSCTYNNTQSGLPPAGSRSETVNTGSGSSKTFSVTCTNSAGQTATDSVTVTVTNPNTPTSCTPISPSQWPSGPHVDHVQVNDPNQCMAVCASYAEANGSTYTCGLSWYSGSHWFFGGGYLYGYGYTETYSACIVGAGSGTTSAPPSTSTPPPDPGSGCAPLSGGPGADTQGGVVSR